MPMSFAVGVDDALEESPEGVERCRNAGACIRSKTKL